MWFVGAMAAPSISRIIRTYDVEAGSGLLELSNFGMQGSSFPSTFSQHLPSSVSSMTVSPVCAPDVVGNASAKAETNSKVDGLFLILACFR
jgi:hypothetical protein